MNLLRSRVVIAGVFIICLVCFQQIQGQSKTDKLSKIQTVFIGIRDGAGGDISDWLRKELSGRGFMIANDRTKADAIFLLRDFKKVSLKSDLYDKWFYHFELVSPARESLWEKKLKLVLIDAYDEVSRDGNVSSRGTSRTLSEHNKKAAEKAAKGLLSARKKALKESTDTK